MKPSFIQRTKAAVSALGSLFGPSTGQLARPLPSPLFGWLNEPHAGAWQRGLQIEPLGGLTAFSAVFACVSLIAGDVAKLAILLKQQQADGTWTEVRQSPLLRVLRKPNHFSTRLQLVEHWIASKLLHGSAYVLKARDADRRIASLYVLDPRRVTPLVTPEGDVYYSLGGDDLSRVPAGMVVPGTEVIHDRGMTLWHPLVGVSPITACAVAATQGLRIQHNSAKFFENMSRPGGVLSAPQQISDEVAARLKREFESSFAGSGMGRIFVAGDGLKFDPMSMPAEDAQLIEQLRWTVEDVARAFGVPLHMLNAGPAPSLNNIEALEQAYYARTLQNTIEALELALDAGFGLPEGQRFELDLRGLLRMDTATRYEALGKAVQGGWMTPNEARRSEDLPPLEGGDTAYLQMQNFSLSALSKRDAKPDPFETATAQPSTRSVSHEVSKQLDELIELMPDEVRSSFLVAKDARWVRKFMEPLPHVVPVTGLVQKSLDGDDLKEAMQAQAAAARAQIEAAEAMRDAANEQASAAREVARTAEIEASLAQAPKADKCCPPWTTRLDVLRDQDGRITGVVSEPIAPVE